jgi:hypothetical protein
MSQFVFVLLVGGLVPQLARKLSISASVMTRRLSTSRSFRRAKWSSQPRICSRKASKSISLGLDRLAERLRRSCLLFCAMRAMARSRALRHRKRMFSVFGHLHQRLLGNHAFQQLLFQQATRRLRGFSGRQAERRACLTLPIQFVLSNHGSCSQLPRCDRSRPGAARRHCARLPAPAIAGKQRAYSGRFELIALGIAGNTPFQDFKRIGAEFGQAAQFELQEKCAGFAVLRWSPTVA